MDLYASRLMVLHTAWKVEHGLPHRQEVAMTKTFVSEAFGRIADRAVQMHGAAGIAMDLPIARIYQDARAARIYDGASRGAPDGDRARPASSSPTQGDSVRPPRACGDPHVIAADDIVRTPTRWARARGSRCSCSSRCSSSSTRTGWGRASRRSSRSATGTPT